MLILGSTVPHLSPSDFSPEQRAGWIATSERKAVMEAAVGPDAGHRNDDKPVEWFVAYTNPKREGMAAEGLKRREFVAYVPTMRVSRTVSRRRVSAGCPLFPRYVFVGLGQGQNLYGLRETPGLEGMVRTAGVPVTVRPAIISGLRVQEGAGIFDFSDEAMSARGAAEAEVKYPPGTAVRIVGGPWLNFTGIVDRLLPDARISVWLTLFGRATAAPMTLADVALR